MIFTSCKKDSSTAVAETPAPPAPLPEYAGKYVVNVSSHYSNSVGVKDTTYSDTVSVVSTTCVPNTQCLRTFTVIGNALKEMSIWGPASQTITFTLCDKCFITYPNMGNTLYFKNDSIFMHGQYFNHLESKFASFKGKRN